MSWKLHSLNLAWQVSYALKNCPAVFVPSGILNELLNKFSYPGLGRPMEFILHDPSCCSSHTPGGFLTPWYPALKMTTPLDHQFSKKFLLEYIKVTKTLYYFISWLFSLYIKNHYNSFVIIYELHQSNLTSFMMRHHWYFAMFLVVHFKFMLMW